MLKNFLSSLFIFGSAFFLQNVFLGFLPDFLLTPNLILIFLFLLLYFDGEKDKNFLVEIALAGLLFGLSAAQPLYVAILSVVIAGLGLIFCAGYLKKDGWPSFIALFLIFEVLYKFSFFVISALAIRNFLVVNAGIFFSALSDFVFACFLYWICSFLAVKKLLGIVK